MLRRSYIEKYKKKSKKNLYVQLEQDDNLSTIQPIDASSIRKLPPIQVRKFTDDVMTNQTIMQTLYSSNANNETDLYLKSRKRYEKNYKPPERKAVSKETDIIRNKKIREAYTYIKKEIDKFKEDKSGKEKTLKKANRIAFLEYKKDNRRLREQFFLPLKENRINEFRKVFENVKEKLLYLKGRLGEGNGRPGASPSIIYNQNSYLELPQGRVDVKGLRLRSVPGVFITNNSLKSVLTSNDPNKNPRKKEKPRYIVRGIERNPRASGEENFLKSIDKYTGGPGASSTSKNFYGKNYLSKFNNFDEGNVDLFNIKMEEGNTFLHYICESDLYELGEYFLESGSNPNAQNDEGNTPLIIACKYRSYEMIELLLHYKADPKIRNRNGEEAYDFADDYIIREFHLTKSKF